MTLPSPIRSLGPTDFAACRALTLDREWGAEDADGSGLALARDEGERLVIGPVAAHDERTACALVTAHPS